MSLDRRFVLKGMAMSGIAGWALGRSGRSGAWVPASSEAATPPLAGAESAPLRVLVEESPLGEVFLQGAVAAGEPHPRAWRATRKLSFLLEFERDLRRGEPMRVIALLDDAAATLVVDLARSAGARLLWLGHHHSSGAGNTHHALRSTARTATCPQELVDRLRACGAGFEVIEERHGHAAPPRHMSAEARNRVHTAAWAFHVGHLLASFEKPASVAAHGVPTIDFAGRVVSLAIDAGGSSRHG